MRYDVAVVGGGIVGLATARAVQERTPGATVLVIEKEGTVAGHQSGRNSGVIHAGVYYKPGSFKAALCIAGREAMVAFCRERGIAHEVCGKLVVATSVDELGRLADLGERCRANAVPCEEIGPHRIAELEPHCAGIRALHVKVTGIADYPAVCAALAAEFQSGGGDLRLGAAVLGGRSAADHVVVETTAGPVEAALVVNCAGLHADRVAAALSGPSTVADIRIVPFRGEYFELAPSRSHLVKALIYPVPDPRFPFLGVHLTRGVSGRVHCGPNAVLGLAREGYSWRHRDFGDLRDTVSFPGFRRLARAHWRYGLAEMHRSLRRSRFAAALQRLVPAVRCEDLEPAPAGVRAQAVRADGTLVDDFEFRRSGRCLHVLNAPSPAATASLVIGRHIAGELGR